MLTSHLYIYQAILPGDPSYHCVKSTCMYISEWPDVYIINSFIDYGLYLFP